MIHVKNVKILSTAGEQGAAKVLKKGFSFECSLVNLLVGDQGCGKSTLLRMLQKNSKDLKLDLAEHVIRDSVQSYYFDSEKDNPRMKNSELYITPSGQDIGIGVGGAIASRFKSHGEIMQWLVVNPLTTAENCVVLLDEPESGLSITNQFRLIKEISAAVERGCQFFIATHCYPLIEAYDVVSLEHWKKMKGEDFIKLAREKRYDRQEKDSSD